MIDVATILAILVLVVGVPLNLFVTLRLRGLARSAPEVKVLRERALVALVVLVIVVVFALIFLNNDLAEPVFSGDVTKIITRAAVLTLAVVPAVYWLWLYR